MRKILLFLIFLTLLGCNERIEKPEKFLEEDEMTNLLYDLTLLTSSRSFIFEDSVFKNISSQHVLDKYNLDSLSFVEINDYYLRKPELYAKMFDTITKRFQKQIENAQLLPNDPRDTIQEIQQIPLTKISSLMK